MTAPDPAVYRKAAQLIRTGGLTQGVYEHGGAHCTVGALRVAKGSTAWTDRYIPTELLLLAELLGQPPCGCSVAYDGLEEAFDAVTAWNDSDGRTADDVTTLLDQAAEKLEADR